MPRLHPLTGLAACGTAGGRISVGSATGEQRVLCDGGCAFWLNSEEVAFLGPLSGSWDGAPGATFPQAVNVLSGQRRPLEPAAAGAALREAHFLAAGGDRWQAAIAGAGYSYGSCGEFPGGTVSRATTDGRGAASQDGTIALVDSYQGENHGFRLGRPDGSVFPPLGAPGLAAGTEAYSLNVIDANRAIWPTVSGWGSFGLDPVPLWLKGSSGRACWCDLGGRVILVHWLNSHGLVAREASSRFGKVLAVGERVYHYDAVPWSGGIRVAWATIDGEPPGSLAVVDWDGVSDLEDLAPPPPPAVIPTFSFTHPVMIVPYKDPEGTSGADFEVCVNGAGMSVERPHFAAGDSLNDRRGELLGIYSEASNDPSKDLALAEEMTTRLLLCRDQPGSWALPAGLRSWDIPARELYLVIGEPPAQAPARWMREVAELLQAWPGDCGVTPMFYCQGGRPPHDEVWPVSDVCAGLASLSEIVNLSPRIKVIAPFSYQRANGIVGHVELQEAFFNLKFAGWKAGVATLLPVSEPEPPEPEPPSLYRQHKEYRMSTKQNVALIGPGGLYGRPGKLNSGPWAGLNRGWRGVIWDGVKDGSGAIKSNKESKVQSNAYVFELSQPDDRHQLYHADADGFFGADATVYAASPGSDQFHIKPASETRGGHESPVIYEGNLTPKLLSGQIEYANDNGPAFVSCGFAVEVLS